MFKKLIVLQFILFLFVSCAEKINSVDRTSKRIANESEEIKDNLVLMSKSMDEMQKAIGAIALTAKNFEKLATELITLFTLSLAAKSEAEAEESQIKEGDIITTEEENEDPDIF